MAMGLSQTKARIRSVASTKKITKAMELVATSKLRKAKDLNTQITPYKNEVLEVMSYCSLNMNDKKNIYFSDNKSNKNLYIIITSTLGLCGGYNVAIEKYATQIINLKQDDLIVVGGKGIHFFKEKGYHLLKEFNELPGFNLKESLSTEITNYILEEYRLQKYKSIKIIYTKFINSLTFDPTHIQLLPITEIVEVKKMNKELLLEPSPEEVLENLIPFYLTTSLKGFIFESMLSEQASRRTAMENATDNASELQEKLLLEFNKSRQASITQEITEISGAANAIK